jgi:hypothetical protein
LRRRAPSPGDSTPVRFAPSSAHGGRYAKISYRSRLLYIYKECCVQHDHASACVRLQTRLREEGGWGWAGGIYAPHSTARRPKAEVFRTPYTVHRTHYTPSYAVYRIPCTVYRSPYTIRTSYAVVLRSATPRFALRATLVPYSGVRRCAPLSTPAPT